MAKGCGAKFAKILLIIFNFVFWVSRFYILYFINTSDAFTSEEVACFCLAVLSGQQPTPPPPPPDQHFIFIWESYLITWAL